MSSRPGNLGLLLCMVYCFQKADFEGSRMNPGVAEDCYAKFGWDEWRWIQFHDR
ncbi:hypothetical protein PAL_GLEAN10024455 [Pteropus alecto]|uniref:Uncharacterized protein n=1 Tax=Pteropus alecto TaxID=9402 RepID=L5K1A1_PTEAL|nr:hypothetical protein PAL_GLEAN10024455 [Pteropus alecto]